MGLTPAQVGAAVGRKDRAMRTVKGLGVREMLDSVWAELGRHRQPKLHPEHAGPIAKFLVEHPDCTQSEVAQFVAAELSIVVDAQTIGRWGAFLLLPAALALVAVAERAFGRGLGSARKARRLVLSLFFRAVLGIERIFHFETVDDLGFALLSGGKKVMSRSRLGGLVRAVTTRAVNTFMRATDGLPALRDQVVTLSADEHVVARFTRKFKIPKGFHTLRNKKMRAEKLSYLYWPKARRFLSLLVSRGNAKLIDLTINFVRALRSRVRLGKLRVILDAGASTSNDGLRRLDRFHKTVFLIRAPRRPGYVNAWKKLPRDCFTHHTEPAGSRAPRTRRSRSPRPPPPSRASPIPCALSSCASAL